MCCFASPPAARTGCSLHGSLLQWCLFSDIFVSSPLNFHSHGQVIGMGFPLQRWGNPLCTPPRTVLFTALSGAKCLLCAQQSASSFCLGPDSELLLGSPSRIKQETCSVLRRGCSWLYFGRHGHRGAGLCPYKKVPRPLFGICIGELATAEPSLTHSDSGEAPAAHPGVHQAIYFDSAGRKTENEFTISTIKASG